MPVFYEAMRAPRHAPQVLVGQSIPFRPRKPFSSIRSILATNETGKAVVIAVAVTSHGDAAFAGVVRNGGAGNLARAQHRRGHHLVRAGDAFLGGSEIDGSVPGDPEPLCLGEGIDVGAEVRELPAVLAGLMFDHAFDLGLAGRAGEFPGAVFLAVGYDHKNDVARALALRALAKLAANADDGSGDSVVQGRHAAWLIESPEGRQAVYVAQGPDLVVLVVKLTERNPALARFFLLRPDETVKATNNFVAKIGHGAGPVEDNGQERGVWFGHGPKDSAFKNRVSSPIVFAMSFASSDGAPYSWRNAPGWFDFEDIYNQAVAEASTQLTSLFVELGVAFGRSAIYMATRISESKKPIAFHAIDNWDTSDLYRRHPDLRRLAEPHGGMRETFEWLAEMAGVRSFITVVQLDQLKAAAAYEDASVDFAFLDTCHTEEGTRAAIAAWLPKIKPGGVFAGHDFTPSWPGVVTAVKALLPEATARGQSFFWRVPLSP